jgi:HD-GYP domain-containing protein (c-di-GMP phosphodiesterase class II)
MTRDRPHQDRISAEAAVEEIRKGSGGQFDPEVVAAFLKLHESGKVGDILK